MTETSRIDLASLAGSNLKLLKLAQPEDELGGLTVLDTQFQPLGNVNGLVIDEIEHRVRYLVVASDGSVCLGRTERLVPIEVVTRIGEYVHIEASAEHFFLR